MRKLFKEQSKSISFQQQVQKQLVQEEFQLSDQQRKYIENEYNSKQDTVLIACAGSGKTLSVVERMRYLAKRQILNKDEMMVFSFSKQTIEHTKNCCKRYSDCNLFSSDKLIMTIDSFCYQLISKIHHDKEACDKNILSAKLHNMIRLKELDVTKFLKRSGFRKIKTLFIDEAQDLNQIQYDIILFFKKVTNCSLHFVGDPNQNIYQFNGSFEKFMLNHNEVVSNEVKMFSLNKNFRSTQQIEEFSKYFQYYNAIQIITQQDEQIVSEMLMDSFNNKQLLSQSVQDNVVNAQISDFVSERCSTNQNVVNQQFVQNNNEYIDQQKQKDINIYIEKQQFTDQFIIKTVRELQQEGIKLQNIAFLSPIIGDQYNSGIKRVANILDQNKIPYIGYYQETSDTNKKNNQHNIKQAINLFTIHGAKGLEYDVVILIKFQDKMMISENYEHSNFVAQNMNLLYVAMTRAKKRLIIVNDDSNNMIKRHVCSLLIQVPQCLYNYNENIQQHFDMIEKKLTDRRKIIDENCEYIKNNQIDDLKDIMLVSKYRLPELFELNIKEGMFQNTSYQCKTCVTKFIQGIDKEDLLQLDDMLKYKKKSVDIYKVTDKEASLFKTIKHQKEALVGILMEQLFFYQIEYHKQKSPKLSKILFTLKDVVLINDSYIKINQFFLIEDQEQFQRILSGIEQIKAEGIQDQYTSDKIFKDIMTLNTISKDEYTKNQQEQNFREHLDFGTISFAQLMIINKNKEKIFNLINNYNKGLPWDQCIEDIIYLCSLKYAIKSKHIKYMIYNQQAINQLKGFESLFIKLDQFAQSLIDQQVFYQVEVDNHDIIGFIDFIFVDPVTQERSIIEFKTTNDLSIEHIMQIIIYDYLLDNQSDTQQDNRLIIVNALKGVQYEIKFDTKDKEEIFQLLSKMFEKDKTNRTSSV